MANPYQNFDEREHTAAVTTVETDVHGKLEGVTSIGPLENDAEYGDIYELGSAEPVGVTTASVKRGMITMQMRSSKLSPFLEALRLRANLPPDIKDLHKYGLTMVFTVTKAPYDEENDPLPVEVKDFKAIYAGFKESINRGQGADPIIYDVMLKPTTPVRLR